MMRKLSHIRLKDAAAHFGVSQQALSAWERGEYSPSVDVLRKMAALYGCTFDELLRNDDEEA